MQNLFQQWGQCDIIHFVPADKCLWGQCDIIHFVLADKCQSCQPGESLSVSGLQHYQISNSIRRLQNHYFRYSYKKTVHTGIYLISNLEIMTKFNISILIWQNLIYFLYSTSQKFGRTLAMNKLKLFVNQLFLTKNLKNISLVIYQQLLSVTDFCVRPV